MLKLIESVIVVILCVIIAICFFPPQIDRGSWKPLASTMSNAKQLSMGALIYAGDFEDHLPYVQTTEGARGTAYAYIKSERIFASLNPNKTRFEFNLALAGVQISRLSDGDNIPIWYESGAWPDGFRIIGTMTGRAKKIKAEEWPEIEATLSRIDPRDGKPLPADLGVGKWKF